LATASIDSPRFSFNPATGESQGFLREQSSTNLQTYSNDLNDASWSKANVTITPNAGTAPDGTNSFILAVKTTGTPFIRRVRTVAANTTYTQTIFVKPYLDTAFQIVEAGATGSTASFTLSGNGSVAITNLGGSPSGTITLLNNGIYKCTFTYTTGAAQTTLYFNNQPVSTYMWGIQLEALGFSTSYIPTIASQVTRAADVANITSTNLSSWYNASQGTFYCEALPFALNASSGNPMTFIGISDNTVNNEIRMSANLTSGGIFESATSGVSQFALGAAVTPNVFTKMAGSYQLNNSSFSQAGGAATIDTSCTIPTVTQMEIGNLISGRELSGYIKKISYYSNPLTSNQLQTITSG